MLVTPQGNRNNRVVAGVMTAMVALFLLVFSRLQPLLLLSLPLSIVLYKWLRRRTKRRLELMSTPFPAKWRQVLNGKVAYYNALDEQEKGRFEKLVQIFLDEIKITGIGTDVDDTVRVLVGASAVIPIFGFPWWEYRALDEVLIYPRAFKGGEGPDEGEYTTGLVAHRETSLMVFSKPHLLSGFANASDGRNVGIHEFAHLVDLADGEADGLPPGVNAEVLKPWVRWVAKELEDQHRSKTSVNPYAYTNRAEYFAVLTEYMFERPGALERKNPELYGMLQAMFRQDTKSLLMEPFVRPHKLGRNSPCPCGSGKKFKHCCL